MARVSNSTPKSEDVDLKRGILYGLLKQVRYNQDAYDLENPPLVAVWCCKISPQETKQFLSFIRSFVTPHDSQSFIHIKRFMKVKDEDASDGSSLLNSIICSENFIETKEILLEMIQSKTSFDTDKLKIFKKYIPSQLPPTREIAQAWSNKFWHMSWKGNPNHQFLKSVVIDIEEEKYMINKLLEALEPSKIMTVPSVTIIARKINTKYEILNISYDRRHENPLAHSVMNGISTIARKEKERRETSISDQPTENNYLCHNLTVFTTLEPCVMCSMALLHSRIGRLVYLTEMNITGALETTYNLGDRDSLNWKFETWKWIGETELQRLESITSSHRQFINI